MRLVKRRHPLRGALFGLLLGIGLGIMVIVYGAYFAGPFTPWFLVIAGVIFGLAVAFVPRPWGGHPPPIQSKP
jgi:drug/metabolite transporter (DMT)-like permease